MAPKKTTFSLRPPEARPHFLTLVSQTAPRTHLACHFHDFWPKIAPKKDPKMVPEHKRSTWFSLLEPTSRKDRSEPHFGPLFGDFGMPFSPIWTTFWRFSGEFGLYFRANFSQKKPNMPKNTKTTKTKGPATR